MAKRIAINNLTASTVNILNTIRNNLDSEYQSLVPEVVKATDIPRVGEVLYGYPALANKFLSALVNRIALVRVKSATFNNAYAQLKKGYLEYGETVEEIFVNIAKARDFSVEKAAAREFKRSLPDVRSAFHTMNWRCQYPVTIQQQELKQAFLNEDGVQDLIARIVDSVYTAAEYDEFLLFKYLIIKAVSHGKMYPVAFNGAQISEAAVSFRGMSNQLTFMSPNYNSAGVSTATSKSEQFIFMDSFFNARYDVDMLSAAFNMDKADFMGHLLLIDSFTTFDNARFDQIRQGSDSIEEVTPEELALMANVKAVLVDREWFQVYDNLAQFTDKFVAAGSYWNYFYNVWKTVSFSPFSNSVVFIDAAGPIPDLPNLTYTVKSRADSDGGTTLALELTEAATISPSDFNFVQTKEAAQLGVAITPYGTIIFPKGVTGSVKLEVASADGVKRYTGPAVGPDEDVGASFSLTPAPAAPNP